MDDKPMTIMAAPASSLGLAATLYDAVALAEIFGPGARIGFAAADGCEILAPAGEALGPDAAAAAAARGKTGYFLAFGNAGVADVARVAALIDRLAADTGLGFMVACVAAPWAGRTVFQGHLFEGDVLRGNLVRAFAAALGGGVGLVPHGVVRAGAAAVRRACSRLKEQGRMLAMIDAIDDDDCAVIAQACGDMKLAGGGAWMAARPPAAADAAPDTASGLAMPIAILAGALDRDTVLQVGAARAEMAVLDLDFSLADPVGAAVEWASARQERRFVIASSASPDRQSSGAPAAAVLGAIAARLAGLGVRRFVLAGSETTAAALGALEVTSLRVGAAWGSLRWLHAGPVAFCIKPAGMGSKNLFLFGMEPQIRLNETAKSAL